MVGGHREIIDALADLAACEGMSGDQSSAVVEVLFPPSCSGIRDARSRTAFLGAARFLGGCRSPSSVPNIDELLSRVLESLKILVVEDPREDDDAEYESFAREIVSSLSGFSRSPGFPRGVAVVSSALLQFFSAAVAEGAEGGASASVRRRRQAARGGLRAVAERPPQMQKEDAESLVRILEAMLSPNSDLLEWALGAAAAVVGMQECSVEVVGRWYEIATSPEVLVAEFVPALRLAVSCAARRTQLGDHLKDVLAAALVGVSQQGDSGEIREEAAFLLTTLGDLAVQVRGDARVVDALTRFLRSALVADDAALRRACCRSLCRVFDSDPSADRGVDRQRQLLDALVGRVRQDRVAALSATGNDASPQLDLICSLVSEMTSIAFEFAMQSLLQLVDPSESLSNLDFKLVLSLVALTSRPTPPQSVLAEVCQLVISVFRRLLKAPQLDESRLDRLTEACVKLSTELRGPGLRMDLCKRVVNLFQQLGQTLEIRKVSTLLKNPTVSVMGKLLAIIAELVQSSDEESVLNPDVGTQSAFRGAWLYCVLLNSLARGEMPQDWRRNMSRVALRMPVLCAGKAHLFAQAEKESEAVLRLLTKDDSPVRKSLLGHLPNSSSQIKGLTGAQCGFLLAVLHLEEQRAKGLEYRALFSYLQDPALLSPLVSNVGYIAVVYKEITEKAFVSLLSSLARTKFSRLGTALGERQSKLAEFCQFLMLHFCSGLEAVRNLADSFIGTLVSHFSSVLWNVACLRTLLELLDLVTRRALGSSPLDETHVPVPGSVPQLFVDLPEETSEVAALQGRLKLLCNTWLREAVKLAPTETLSVLQSFVSKLGSACSPLGKVHYGVVLASETLAVASSPFKQQLPIGGPVTTEDLRVSMFVTSLAAKAAFSGRIAGMIQAMKGTPESAACAVGSSLIPSFAAIQPDSPIEDLVSIVYQACAFVVVQPASRISEQLISRIVWVPVRTWTKQAMEVAVSAWSWLLGSSTPAHRDRLMSQMWLAWSWTIDSRMGLFSSAKRQPSPMVEQTNRETASRNPKADHTPHRLWLAFLEEHLVVAESSESGDVDVLFRMLYKACADSSLLSALPESFGCRFHMLGLALKLSRVLEQRRYYKAQRQDVPVLVDPCESIFVDRIHAAALTWFNLFPAWYEAASRTELQDDVSQVLEFCNGLLQQVTYQKTPQARPTVVSKSVTPTVASDKQSVRSSNSITSFLSKQSGVVSENDPDRRSNALLAVLLLANELERIAVWNNPLNRPFSQVVSADQLQKLKETDPAWARHVETAWNFSPTLAVMLWVRHQSVDKLRQLVTRKILQSPSSVNTCPQALNLLVTEEHVRRNIPQLEELLYWASTDPPSALSMLRRQFLSHPLVTQYALRVLSGFSPETIIFYLPQLVQCLRYDKTGLVEEYLVKASARSDLVAHQVIWNARTYQIDAAFAPVVERVRQRIVAGFTPEASKHYDEEVAFFDQFTDISSRLVQVAPEKRTEALVDELHKIPPLSQGFTYLPFAPDVVVCEVDTRDPRVLKSAEKAPIMVNFKVRPRDQPHAVPTRHPCIFKSGDDTRQDMLALQVIGLLKRVFDHSSLDLFLFPYKIVATKPGCGIIEVVPNAKSRDELGHNTEGTIFDYYVATYGPRTCPQFHKARNNFIRSMAAYAIASYLIQVKDRHNGNIMFDKEGHLIHIDFGFLFDRTPGGDFGFEKAPFKLTKEMIDIMGGSPRADQFVWFMEQGVKAFLAAREYQGGFTTLVELMLDTQLPCFKPVTMENLNARFFPAMTTKAAAKAMVDVMTYAFSSVSTWTTFGYDFFQSWDNGISM